MHYNLSAIIAVGYKVNSERAVQFRKWATTIIKEYTIKAYVMDDERIKSGGSILTEQYFEEQLNCYPHYPFCVRGTGDKGNGSAGLTWGASGGVEPEAQWTRYAHEKVNFNLR